MPLWIWNGKVTRERIDEMLQSLHGAGMGGVFVHPRPGLLTEYLSEEWFALWNYAADACEKLGMECHVYDENTFPSGFAGGHVPANNPLTQLKGWVAERYDSGNIPWKESYVAAFRWSEQASIWDRLENGMPLGLATPAAPLITISWRDAELKTWHGGFAYVDLSRPETTQEFIRQTHDRYEASMGQRFGKSLKYFFTDEPSIQAKHWLTVSWYFLEEFRREHGYDLTERVGDFLQETATSAKTRFDYFYTLDRLFVANFCGQIYDWCESRGVAFTGHFDEHNWPDPCSAPDVMHAQAWMQAPGIDLLGFQFKADAGADNSLYLLTVKELSSVGAQKGRKNLLCEAYGGGGYDMGPDRFRSLSVFLLANGVDLIVPHLSHQTLQGSRKYDWAQSISPHSSWYECYRAVSDPDARVVEILRASRPANRVLLLHPTLSAWLHFTPSSFCTVSGRADVKDKLHALRDSQAKWVAMLASYGVDFDLGDEKILAECARTDSGKLAVGESRYDCVIVPDNMEVMLSSTVSLLQSFLDAGGSVVSVGQRPSLVDAISSDAVHRLSEHEGWINTSSRQALLSTVLDTVRPRLSRADGKPFPSDCYFSVRVLEDGSLIYLLANAGAETRTFDVLCPADGLVSLSPEDASVQALGSRGAAVSLSLPPRQMSLWMGGVSDQAKPVVAKQLMRQPVSVALESVEPLQDNVLVIESCDYRARGGDWVCDASTPVADREIWRAHGFAQSPWVWAIQYKRTLLDHQFPSDSGCALRYHFRVAEELSDASLNSLCLAIEQPWLYRALFNGQPCTIAEGERWLDESVRRVSLGGLVQRGVNTLELVAAPFPVECEVAPIYITGNFAVESSSEGWTISPPRPVYGLGAWEGIGRRFDQGKMRYSFLIQLQGGAQEIEVHLEGAKGSAAKFFLDGQNQYTATNPALPVRLHGSFAAGEHRLQVELFGSPKNLFGPYFNNGLPIPWNWENRPARPTCADFLCVETGLMSLPTVTVC